MIYNTVKSHIFSGEDQILSTARGVRKKTPNKTLTHPPISFSEFYFKTSRLLNPPPQRTLSLTMHFFTCSLRSQLQTFLRSSLSKQNFREQLSSTLIIPLYKTRCQSQNFFAKVARKVEKKDIFPVHIRVHRSIQLGNSKKFRFAKFR